MHHAVPEVVDGDVARDREQPRLERPRRIVRVPGAVQGHERVLVDVLELVRVGDATAQEAEERGGYVGQKRTICLAISPLRAFHPPGSLRAVGSEVLFVHS